MCSSADSKINEGEKGRLKGVSFHFKHKAKLHCIRLEWDTLKAHTVVKRYEQVKLYESLSF